MSKKEKPSFARGFQFMAMALPLIFLGPTIFNMALKNKEHPYFIPIIIFGVLIIIAALYIAIKGLKIIMKTLFEEE